MDKPVLIGIILEKTKGKIPIVLCEFIKDTQYIRKNNGEIIMQTQLEINNIKQIFNSKREFILWLKQTGNHGKIPFNKCMRDKLNEYLKC